MFNMLNIIVCISLNFNSKSGASALTGYSTIVLLSLKPLRGMKVRTIDVDFDVFKALTLRRPNESVTENDVLRQLLGLPPNAGKVGAPIGAPSSGDWITKGVRFPVGTEFRANHKGQLILGKVESGGLMIGENRFDSPSSAAVSITGNSVNGWRFWECRLPGQTSWRLIDSLRKK